MIVSCEEAPKERFMPYARLSPNFMEQCSKNERWWSALSHHVNVVGGWLAFDLSFGNCLVCATTGWSYSVTCILLLYFHRRYNRINLPAQTKAWIGLPTKTQIFSELPPLLVLERAAQQEVETSGLVKSTPVQCTFTYTNTFTCTYTCTCTHTRTCINICKCILYMYM